MSNPFRYYLRVRYGECDAQRVVFNPRWADYVDIGSTEFFRALGFGEALASGAIDYQLVKLTIEWKAPARFDQVIELSIYSTHLGNTSFTVVTEFRIADVEQVICRAETVYVNVDPKALTKLPLSAQVRAALESGAPGKVVDHASRAASAAAS
ncbi:MAG: thioesterase family protein [Bryobacteraceae bacterium]|jgi:acyl-CoA thioester hydrolase